MKTEPLLKEIRAIRSMIRAHFALKFEQHKRNMADAGILLHKEAEAQKNRQAQIRRNAEIAMRNTIKRTGVISCCCGAAILKNFHGDDVCSECLNVCDRMAVK